MLPYCVSLFKLQGSPQVPGQLQDEVGVGKHAYLKNSELWSCDSTAPKVSTGVGPGAPGLAGSPRGAEVRVTGQAPSYVSHSPLLLPFLQREGQLNREMLKPPLKAMLLPLLEPHKGCRSG